MDTLTLEEEASGLDLLVLKLVGILSRHVPYVIVSTYVAVLLGYTKAIEEVDMLLGKLSKEQFIVLLRELLAEGFWCINGEGEEELFALLSENVAIRLAEKDRVVPHFKLSLAKDAFDELAIAEKMKVLLPQGEMYIATIPRQIAYNQVVSKHLEDALYLQQKFAIPEEEIERQKKILKEYGRV